VKKVTLITSPILLVGIALAVLFSGGCATRYEYRGALATAADLIGGNWDPTTAKIILPSPPASQPASGNPTLTLPAEANTLSGAPSSARPIPTPFPYFLVNRQQTANGYEWDVKQDTSGIYMDTGKLRISKQGDSLVVDAPNKRIENYVIEVLQLKPTH
jgi:hypothetical protein